jgi:hypothetical protein
MLQLKTRNLILDQLCQLDESVLLGLWSDLLSKKKRSKQKKFEIKPFKKSTEPEIKANFSYFNDSNFSNQFTKYGVRYSRRKSLKNKISRT